jgi:hypothetical protein
VQRHNRSKNYDRLWTRDKGGKPLLVAGWKSYLVFLIAGSHKYG